jgi:iron complex outermembrane recepter protein
MSHNKTATGGSHMSHKSVFAERVQTTTIGCVIASLAMAASAASTPPGDGSAQTEVGHGLEEIIIVAQKRSESMQSVPISISALTGEALEKYGVDHSLLNLSFATPGLQTAQIVQGFAPFIRGIGSTDVTPGNENAVSVYVDGVYIPGTASGLVSLASIERYEVLKGPQGTLFGRNTTGGLIHVITKTPSHETGGDISVSYDNFETPIVNGYATTGLGENVAVDIAGRWEDQGESWGTNNFDGADAYKKHNNNALRSKMLVTPGEDTAITLAADYFEYTNDVTPWRKEVPSGFFDYNQDLNADMKGEVWGVSAHIEHEFDFAKLVSISAYRDMEQSSKVDIDQGPTPFQHGFFTSYQEAFSQELQLVSKDSGKLEWIAGLYYFDREAKFDPVAQKGLVLKLAFNPALDLFEGYNTQDTNSYAAFAQATYELFANTHLTLGIRYSHDEQDYEGHTIRYPVSGTPVVSPDATDDFQTDKSTYRVVLDHQFTPDVMGYISFNTGYKTGFYNIAGFPADSAGPEFLDAYEVGLKSELFDNRLRLNVAAYYYDYQDVQALYLLNGLAVAINAGSAEVKGFEAEATAVPVDNWNIRLGFNWMPDADYNEFTPCPGPQNPPFVFPPGSAVYDCSDSRMVNAPKWDVSLGTDYTIRSSVGDLNFSVALKYTSDFPWDADFGDVRGYNTGVYEEPSRTLTNAQVKWTSLSEIASVTVWGRNLTDEEYQVYGTQTAGSGKMGMPGEPRTYGVTLGYHF